jgi:hypothetical protein
MTCLAAVPARQGRDADTDWFPPVDLAETTEEYAWEPCVDLGFPRDAAVRRGALRVLTIQDEYRRIVRINELSGSSLPRTMLQ